MAYSDEQKIGKIWREKSYCQEINLHSVRLKNSDFLDTLTKTAILTTLAGYKQCDYIYVFDKFNRNINLRKLSRYLSYILNHKEFAPRKYNIKVTDAKSFSKKNSNFRKNYYDGIISFSGGIDSTAGLLYFLDKGQHIQPLWIDFGQRNGEAELKSVKRVLGKIKTAPLTAKMDINKFILDGWKDWDYIIPGRNFLFISFANNILKNSTRNKVYIYLCAHKDEMVHRRNTDKSKYFFKKASQLFSLDSGKKVIVTTPFSHVTKAEILSYWKKHWIKKYGISPHDTTSCYYGRGCGRCEVCLKRTVSLLASGFGIDPFIKDHPMKDHSGLIAKKWIPQMLSGKLSRDRKLDLLIAIGKSLKVVPDKVKKIYLNLPRQTLLAIKRRKEEIANAEI